ncbi:sugar ABC transporter substrate-binding protein [Aestuariicoccus sp. MJ-SS9]|uniref:ABC transporter substrate-binding protein n=1 Tax=Aestuariicoccus sp. MJ-SS9 TaxID=3079855 RepID=UPI00290A07AA|nr:sugar ABC transporter substrate-binding protein [Aestuariicoccus sp. MJ-SS9]MDU8913952.1 sugar ABC transporter substrate-binding protein [Aestuariicoccus sp. MJ-SS9]
MTFKKRFTGTSTLTAIALTGFAAAPAMAQEEASVFFMLPNSTTIRFERRDAPLYVAAMKERMPDATVTVQNGEGDPERQQRLVEDALAQGADLIVYTSSDANLAAGALKAAEEAGVPVLLYEHDAIGGKAEAHVLFNARAVGQAQGKRAAELIEAMPEGTVRIARVKGNQGEYGTTQYELGQNEYLDQLIESGRVEVVCEDFTPNWDPVQAQAFAENCLTRTGGNVDMFLGMNDGTTGGSVAALISQGYQKGEVVVTGGQDATIEAVQFVVQGWQDNTIFKDLRVMAEAAADLSVNILNGEDLSSDWINDAVNNEFMDVPAAFLPVDNVTIDNVATVVEAGLYTWEQICEGAEDTQICQDNM